MFDFTKKITKNLSIWIKFVFLSTLDSQRGAAMTIYVLIIMGATLIMASVASEAGLHDLEMSYQDQRLAEAYYVAEACAEETLRRVRIDHDYGVGLGDINLSAFGDECIITVSDVGGGARELFAQAEAFDDGGIPFHKTVYVTFTIDPSNNKLILTGWTEM